MPFSRFELFPNTYFVETGSYRGDGIKAALAAGFNSIHSIEITDKYFHFCCDRFRDFPQVRLYRGDSTILLGHVIAKLREPITFWLDGHWSMEDTGYGQFKFPLLHELETIEKHPIKTHTIIIDDVRLFKEQWGIEPLEVLGRLSYINPEYKFEFYDGYIPGDVLVACVK